MSRLSIDIRMRQEGIPHADRTIPVRQPANCMLHAASGLLIDHDYVTRQSQVRVTTPAEMVLAESCRRI